MHNTGLCRSGCITCVVTSSQYRYFLDPRQIPTPLPIGKQHSPRHAWLPHTDVPRFPLPLARRSFSSVLLFCMRTPAYEIPFRESCNNIVGVDTNHSCSTGSALSQCSEQLNDEDRRQAIMGPNGGMALLERLEGGDERGSKKPTKEPRSPKYLPCCGHRYSRRRHISGSSSPSRRADHLKSSHTPARSAKLKPAAPSASKAARSPAIGFVRRRSHSKARRRSVRRGYAHPKVCSVTNVINAETGDRQIAEHGLAAAVW